MKKIELKKGMVIMLAVDDLTEGGLVEATIIKLKKGKVYFQLRLPFSDATTRIRVPIEDVELTGEYV